MRKSGLADSPFFSAPQKKRAAAPLSDTSPNDTKQKENHTGKPPAVKQPVNRDTVTPRNHDTTVSRYHDTIIELVRKAVKEFGKEAATHRFTVEEKKRIAEIIFSYKNQGVRTSENELTRIAVNFLLGDYQKNGKNSVLAKVLKALNE